MKNGRIHQEDIKILSIYKPNNRSSKICEAKLTEQKGEIDKSTIFKISLSAVNVTVNKTIKHKSIGT